MRTGSGVDLQVINYAGISGTAFDPNSTILTSPANNTILAEICFTDKAGKAHGLNGVLIGIGFANGGTLSLGSISDSTSNTLGIAEQSRKVKMSNGTIVEAGASGYRGGGWHGGFNGLGTTGASNFNVWTGNMTTVRYTINAVCPATGALCNLTYGGDTIITSNHSNGVNAGAMDGSVHFITENVNFQGILLPLCSRADRKAVALP